MRDAIYQHVVAYIQLAPLCELSNGKMEDRVESGVLTARPLTIECSKQNNICSERNFAMSSAPAYRPGLPANKVIDALLEQTHRAFDRV